MKIKDNISVICVELVLKRRDGLRLHLKVHQKTDSKGLKDLNVHSVQRDSHLEQS